MTSDPPVLAEVEVLPAALAAAKGSLGWPDEPPGATDRQKVENQLRMIVFKNNWYGLNWTHTVKKSMTRPLPNSTTTQLVYKSLWIHIKSYRLIRILMNSQIRTLIKLINLILTIKFFQCCFKISKFYSKAIHAARALQMLLVRLLIELLQQLLLLLAQRLHGPGRRWSRTWPWTWEASLGDLQLKWIRSCWFDISPCTMDHLPWLHHLDRYS